ncbi:hypothetical protein B0J13DRAFT_651586 [Dactylonectria estremocensis]|uniref:Uncharacterized protein n=1 Tax=Dactylonectria estremocensis TaxID=1079267 RepID=A0A9P9IF38_9HYPO|nr:hypothetical protein B0J13DRAFT_651586 [Dactylonectria estremocensis]
MANLEAVKREKTAFDSAQDKLSQARESKQTTLNGSTEEVKKRMMAVFEERKAEEARKEEETRMAEEAGKEEAVRKAKEAGKEEAARKAKEAGKEEETRKAEEARNEETRKAEEARNVETRKAEAARKKAEGTGTTAKVSRAASSSVTTGKWNEIEIPGYLREDEAPGPGKIEYVVARGYLFVTEPGAGSYKRGYLLSGSDYALNKKRFLKGGGDILSSESPQDHRGTTLYERQIVAVAVVENLAGGLAQATILMENDETETLPSGKAAPNHFAWTLTGLNATYKAKNVLPYLDAIRLTVGQPPIPSKTTKSSMVSAMEAGRNERFKELEALQLEKAEAEGKGIKLETAE